MVSKMENNNIMVLLCQHSDTNQGKVINFFNEIEREKDNAPISFDIFTAINTVEQERDLFRLGLYMIRLVKGGGVQVAPLGIQEFRKTYKLNTPDYFTEHEALFSETMIGNLKVQNHVFPADGFYQVVACELGEYEDLDEILTDEDFPSDRIISSFSFRVI